MKDQLIDVIHEVLQMKEALSIAAPDMSGAPNILALLEEYPEGVPREKVEEFVTEIESGAPEEARDQFLEMLLNTFNAIKKDVAYEKWRIDSRIQPEGKPREEKKPFKSFCRRKGEW